MMVRESGRALVTMPLEAGVGTIGMRDLRTLPRQLALFATRLVYGGDMTARTDLCRVPFWRAGALALPV
jgi:hypothetical protein